MILPIVDFNCVQDDEFVIAIVITVVLVATDLLWLPIIEDIGYQSRLTK